MFLFSVFIFIMSIKLRNHIFSFMIYQFPLGLAGVMTLFTSQQYFMNLNNVILQNITVLKYLFTLVTLNNFVSRSRPAVYKLLFSLFLHTFFSKKLFSSLLMSPQSAWVLLLFSQESLKKFSLYWYPS